MNKIKVPQIRLDKEGKKRALKNAHEVFKTCVVWKDERKFPNNVG